MRALALALAELAFSAACAEIAKMEQIASANVRFIIVKLLIFVVFIKVTFGQKIYSKKISRSKQLNTCKHLCLRVRHLY
jgi:hypothetical protein